VVAVEELTYVVVGVKALEAWGKFATQVMGLEVYFRDAKRLYPRSHVHAYRISAEQSDTEDLITLGWFARRGR
jgi:hypothetical protein